MLYWHFSFFRFSLWKIGTEKKDPQNIMVFIRKKTFFCLFWTYRNFYGNVFAYFQLFFKISREQVPNDVMFCVLGSKTMKRIIDNLIYIETNIPSSEKLVTKFQASCEGVIVKIVQDKECDFFLKKTIQMFKGKGKIH